MPPAVTRVNGRGSTDTTTDGWAWCVLPKVWVSKILYELLATKDIWFVLTRILLLWRSSTRKSNGCCMGYYGYRDYYGLRVAIANTIWNSVYYPGRRVQLCTTPSPGRALLVIPSSLCFGRFLLQCSLRPDVHTGSRPQSMTTPVQTSTELLSHFMNKNRRTRILSVTQTWRRLPSIIRLLTVFCESLIDSPLTHTSGISAFSESVRERFSIIVVYQCWPATSLSLMALRLFCQTI